MGNERIQNRQIPIVEGLLAGSPDEPHLLGGRCKTCGRYFFPKSYPAHKPGCLTEDVEELELGRQGKLKSYTWMYYKPPLPFRVSEPFVPYGIGLVELPEGIRVIGMLTGCQPEGLKTDMDVVLVIGKLYDDDQGNELVTWKFRPI